MIERLAFEASRTAKSPGSEAVHDLRVAIRRLEQALVTLKLHLPRKPVKRLRKRLKSVLSAAGALRDYDISLQILARIRQRGASDFVHHLQGKRKQAEKSLLLMLRGLSLRTRISKWCIELGLNAPDGDFSAQTLEQIARRTLPQLERRFFRAGERAASRLSNVELHEFRILAKKFRYTLELFVPIYGSELSPWLAALKAVQSILGDINDYRTVQSMTADLGCGQKLRAALKRSERRRVRRFAELWAERFTPPARSQWAGALPTPGEDDSIARKPMMPVNVVTARAAGAHA